VSWSLIEPDILRYRRTISSSSAHLSHMSDPHSRANGGPRWPQYYKTTDRRNCSNQASQNQTRPLGAGPYFGACNSKKEPHVIQKAACLATCIEHPMWWPGRNSEDHQNTARAVAFTQPSFCSETIVFWVRIGGGTCSTCT
jgi:hypothetical protein